MDSRSVQSDKEGEAMTFTRKLTLFFIPVVLVLAGVLLSYAVPEQGRVIDREVRLFGPMGGFRLGVVLSPLPEKEGNTGVMVERVLPDSPAEKAGIREGDILKRIDGQSVADAGDVKNYLRKMEDQETVQLDIERDGKAMTLPVTPEARRFALWSFAGGYLGVDLQELNPDLASYFNVSPDAGVLVTSVEKDSPAEKAGILSGDVITTVDGKGVHSAGDVREALRDLEEGQEVPITVLRHGNAKDLTARIENRKPFLPDMPEFRHLSREIPEVLKGPEFQKEMDNLKREMDKMKLQIEQLKKQDLEKLQKELEKEKQELQKQMKELQKELEHGKGET
jgi:C-terminal processing protease CtpA/Prc